MSGAAAETTAGRIEVAMGFNRPYLPYAAAVVRSLLDHEAGERVRFHLLHDGMPDADARKLRELVEGAGAALELHPMDKDTVAGLPGSHILPPVVSMRLLLPQLLPGVDRIVYLDSDIVVLDSIEGLWAAELGEHMIAAAHNVVEAPMARHVQALGLDPSSILNSGVMVLQLDQMRAAGAVERLLQIWEDRTGELLWADQDVLNIGFAGAWAELHPRWNAQNSLYTLREVADGTFGADAVAEAVAHPAIRHFEGPSLCKPWHYLCTWPHVREFRDALARTPWAGEVVLEDRTAFTRLIRNLPERWQLPAYRGLVRARARLRR